MIFEKTVRIPAARVAVLIGRRGRTKAAIEKGCAVSVEVDSSDGTVTVRSDGGLEAAVGGGGAAAGGGGGSGEDAAFMPLKAAEIVAAIGRGFAPDRAMSLLDGERSLHVIDLREFAGRSPSQIGRIKGRIIGERGRARRSMESLTGASISVYGRTVAVIGTAASLKMAVEAISSLSAGSMHGAVYGRLEAARRRQKAERMVLWEGQNVP